MFHGRERGKGFWIKRAIFIPIAIAAGVGVLTPDKLDSFIKKV